MLNCGAVGGGTSESTMLEMNEVEGIHLKENKPLPVSGAPHLGATLYVIEAEARVRLFANYRDYEQSSVWRAGDSTRK